MTVSAPAQAPVVDASGRLAQAWREFMRNLASDTSEVGDYYQSARTDLGGGWLLCDGSSVAQSDYPALYSLIGAQMGGGSGGSFPLPTIPPVYAHSGTPGPGELPIMQTWIKAR